MTPWAVGLAQHLTLHLQAINKACQFMDKTLTIDWYDPFAKRGVAPVVALSRHDIMDDMDETDDKTEAGAETEAEVEEAGKGQEQAVPQGETQQEIEPSQPAN